MLIDAKYKLKPTHIQQFESASNGKQVNVLVDNNLVAISEYDKLEYVFRDENLETIITDDNSIIDFVQEDNDNVLEIAGIDYKWWIAPVRNKKYARLAKLFNTAITVDVKETKKSSTNKLYKVYAAELDDDGHILTYNEFEGKKQEVIDFMNKFYAKNYLRHRFVDKSVFLLNPDLADGQSPLDIKEWKSFMQLADEGKVTLEGVK